VLDAVRDEKTLAELAKQHDVHPHQIIDWKNQLLAGAADVFVGERHDPPIDVKSLHVKIGQQALEIDFFPARSTRRGCGAQSDDRPQP